MENTGEGAYDRATPETDPNYTKADSTEMQVVAVALFTAGDKGEFYNCQIVSN